nr:MAG TPA: hypothetical protein [Caudoviricetes sp.]
MGPGFESQPDHEGDSKRVSLFCYNQMPVFFFCLF